MDKKSNFQNRLMGIQFAKYWRFLIFPITVIFVLNFVGAKAFAQIDLRPPETTTLQPNGTITIPMTLTNPAATPIDAIGFQIIFPAYLIDSISVSNVGTLTDGWMFFNWQKSDTNQLKIGGFNLTATPSSGVLVNVFIRAKTGIGGKNSIKLREFVDDLSGATTQDGLFEITRQEDILAVLNATAGPKQKDVPVLLELTNITFPVGAFRLELLYDTQYLGFSAEEIANPGLAIRPRPMVENFETFSCIINPTAGPGTMGKITILAIAETDLTPPVQAGIPTGQNPLLEIRFDSRVPTPMAAAIVTTLDLIAGSISNENGSIEIGSTLVDGLFTIDPCIPGDTNQDGLVGIADVVYLINCLLGTGACPLLCSGDVNADDILGVADVVYLIHCLMGIGPCPGDQLLNLGLSDGAILSAEVSGDVTFAVVGISENPTQVIPVVANLEQPAAAVHLRFKYDPESVTAGKPSPGKAVKDFQMIFDDRGSEIDVAIYSLTGQQIRPGTAELLQIPIEFKTDRPSAQAFGLIGLDFSDVSGKALAVLNAAQDLSAAIIGLPENYALRQNYPNPFNAGTVIEYNVPDSEVEHPPVEFNIFNIKGQLVRQLVNGKQGAGNYKITWDGLDQNQKSVPTGIYFYNLQVAEHSYWKRMVLVK